MLTELSLIEALWIVISAVGLAFAIVNLADARSDVVAALLVHNYRRITRLVLARGRVHRNWVRVGVFVGWLGLGIAFGFFNIPREVGLGGLLVLMIGAAGLAYTGVQEARERREVAALLADDVAEDLRSDHDEEVAKAEEAISANEQAARMVTSRHDEITRSMRATANNTERIAHNTEREG